MLSLLNANKPQIQMQVWQYITWSVLQKLSNTSSPYYLTFSKYVHKTKRELQNKKICFIMHVLLKSLLKT